SMAEMVRADWRGQEERLGRTPGSPEAIEAVVKRAAGLLADMGAAAGGPDVAAEAAELRRLTDRAAGAAALAEAERVSLYEAVRAVVRRLIVKHPLVASQPIVFMQRHRAVGYMLYEYLGWYYAYGYDPSNGARNSKFSTPATGGGVYLLEEPGRSMKARELTGGRLGPGHYVTLSMSFDGKTLYFSFADPAGKDPYSLPGYERMPTEAGAKYNTFHIFAMDADGSNIRQLTDGPDDDFDPCPLPDGGIAFESTRRGSKLRCGGGSPEIVYTLHRMNSDGSDIRTLSFHETHEWHPSVLNDGRIVFTRWDYVDRNAAKFHGLWTCNPDGTNPAVLFGNYTTRPWASYQAKAIPGSNRIVFVGGGHHANVGGTLVVLDPSRSGLDAGGQDRFDSLEWLTPEVCFAEAEGWPKSYFYSPWPLAEGYMLVSFSQQPLPGGYTGSYRDGETGLYYMDRFGNLELLFRREGISSVYPIPLKARPSPPVVAEAVEAALEAEGEFLLADVNKSLFDLPGGRRITSLRVVQVLPKSRTDNAGDPRIGYPNESNARMLLGTVPVEADGSAYFRAPALKPLYFQAVDEAGRAVHGMRSVVYLQPGERRSCVGCHERPGTAAPVRRPIAATRPASVIDPGPDGSGPFSYPRLVQPVLDRHCVRCHDGSAGADKSPLVLTGDGGGWFSKSYDSLGPYVRWPSYDAVTRPGQLGADTSPLAEILTGGHLKYVALPDESMRRLYLWLDLHVPFYGTYEKDDLVAQRQGKVIAPPPLQ
ncbi:MAG: hypothetical protein IH624_16395, partial [Phycisphaerae bacterium]|nr:hypothetical protein [Phycisphaerae bacterium]